jgi:plasmid maintenance system antidote protein VapI
MSNNLITVGSILNDILSDNEIKYITIVKTTGIPKSTFSKIVSNKTPITVEADALITKSLGLSQGYLLDIQKMMDIYNLNNDKAFQKKIKHIKSLVPNINVNS